MNFIGASLNPNLTQMHIKLKHRKTTWFTVNKMLDCRDNFPAFMFCRHSRKSETDRLVLLFDFVWPNTKDRLWKIALNVLCSHEAWTYVINVTIDALLMNVTFQKSREGKLPVLQTSSLIKVLINREDVDVESANQVLAHNLSLGHFHYVM